MKTDKYYKSHWKRDTKQNELDIFGPFAANTFISKCKPLKQKKRGIQCYEQFDVNSGTSKAGEDRKVYVWYNNMHSGV